MKNKKNRILLLLCAALLSGCATVYNPATGRNESLFIDTRQEVAIGKDMDLQIKKEMPVSDDYFMVSRLRRIGDSVSAASDRKDLSYHFNVIEDEQLNAFAAPGGYVYVNSGLIKQATDDELACVLAHEIGHVAAKHSVKKLQATLGFQLLLNIALGAKQPQDTKRAVNTVFNAISLGYSRQDEYLADKLAVIYAVRSGHDPNAMVTFFEKLKKESEKQGPNLRPVFLSSHPPIEERIKMVKQEINNASYLQKSYGQ